ncbi:MAG: tetratricopeptide repeat protein [Bacteroidaceae bacterium]|nr:tetratricopeptide repeat protein [Bacteroidaceae bacterium]MBP9637067.1 tetratricopeptide repeat protein [Bacteroidaceae bacterium]
MVKASVSLLFFMLWTQFALMAVAQQKDSVSSKKFDYFFLESERLKEKGDIVGAFEMLRYCQQLDPFSAIAKSSIAPFYLSMRLDSLGMLNQRQAVELAPDNYWYAVQLSNLYQAQHNYAAAIDVLEKVVKRFPEKEDAQYELLELYPQVGKYKNAIQLLDTIELRLGKSEELSMRKVQLYLIDGKDTEAFKEAKNLVKAFPDEPRFQCLLGDLYMTQERYPEALKVFQQVLKQDPSNEQSMLSMIDYYESQQDTINYRKQVRATLFNPDISNEAKVLLMRQIATKTDGSPIDSVQVVALFQELTQNEKEDVSLPLLYAQYLVTKGHNQAAIPVLEQVIRIDPTNVSSRLELLAGAVKQNNPQRVVDICKPALEATPQVVEFYYYLAVGYAQQNKNQLAIEALKGALSHTDENTKPEQISDFYALMGDLYHEEQQPLQSYAAYDSALVHQALNVGALNNYAYYLSLENKELLKAEQMSKKTVDIEPNNETYLDTYAWILYMQKRYTEARIYMDRALQNGGEKNPTELDHAGDIYIKLKLNEQAINFWTRAIELKIENPEKLEKKIKRASH